MATKRLTLLLSSLLLASACGEPEEAPPVVDDQSWDDLSSNQRYEHLQRKLEENLETLRTTADGGAWHAAAGEAVRSLSLIRVEGGLDDPQAYAELEAEVESLTDTPPTFAQPR